MERPDIVALFAEFNETYFNGEIPDIPVVWNTRLRTTAGKAYYRRSGWDLSPTKIELNPRLFENNGWQEEQFHNTLLHEMVHAWMYERFNEKGHNWRFHEKMTEITGVWKNHRCHNYDVTGLKEERNVEIHCERHGVIGHRARMPNKSRTYTHTGCGQKVSFKRKQTATSGGISLD